MLEASDKILKEPQIPKLGQNIYLPYMFWVSEVEPYGVFADLIPQKALNRVQQNQARQSDIRADLPHQTLGIKQTYIEIKTVSESVRERRVAAIGDEYEDNSKVAEIKLFGGNDGQGPGSRLASVGQS